MELMTRRQALRAFAVLSAAFVCTPAMSRETLQALMSDLMDAEPAVADWLILTAPEEADNPSAVKVRVQVVPPKELGIFCEEVLLVLEKNPRPAACRFTFSSMTEPDFTTNLRFAEGQEVMALARMSDGSVVTAKAPVKLTVGGCGL